jgi:hypothetical protein
MKYFCYLITDEEVMEFKGELSAIPPGFIEYEATLSGLNVYYRIMNGKITEVIAEAFDEQIARERVENFLATFIVTPFEPL